MPRYVKLGDIPPKRHTQFRRPDGSLYSEQVFGAKGFSGIASILYHTNPPTQVSRIQNPLHCAAADLEEMRSLRHRHLKTAGLALGQNPVTERIPLMKNSDVQISIAGQSESASPFYKNADGDELLFIHEGEGILESQFGTLNYHAGDYLIIPRGVIYQLQPAGGQNRILVIESYSPIEIPRRYRNEYGQLLEHAPFCERDIRVPENLQVHAEEGDFDVLIRSQGSLYTYTCPVHPFDTIGWDGYLYPWALNILDFEPVTGSLHQPPPAHQTFEAHNFVVCSFVPRMLDYHPLAVPAPYNHSNVDSDEMIYYVNGSFSSRKGIEKGSITLHPSGIPHGPHPGAVEGSLGKSRTDELAVMVDTFRPLKLVFDTAAIEDVNYYKSWNYVR